MCNSIFFGREVYLFTGSVVMALGLRLKKFLTVIQLDLTNHIWVGGSIPRAFSEKLRLIRLKITAL